MPLPSNEHIIKQLREANLLIVEGQSYVLNQVAVDKMLGAIKEEEQQVIYWTKVVQYKWQASVCCGQLDYLSKKQLNGLSAYEARLYLSQEERDFITESRRSNKQFLLWGCLGKGLLAILLVGILSWCLKLSWVDDSSSNQQQVNSYILLEQMDSTKSHYLCKQQDSSGHYYYGFINKNQKISIPCTYESATIFDKMGLARVRENNTWYYIDTNNQQYSLALSLDELNDTTKALELANRGLTKIPKAVYRAKQLHILNLSDNKIETVEEELKELDNLTHLNLKGNEIKKVPAVIHEMKQLKEVNLESNPIETPKNTSTALTIHFGGNKMQSQVHESKYGRRTKKAVGSKEMERPIIEVPIAQEEISNEVESIKNNAQPIAKENTKRVVLEGFKTLVQQGGVAWKYKLQPYGEQYKLLVLMVITSNRVAATVIPKKTTKMIFVSGFERQVYDFEFASEQVLLGKQKGYLNACILEPQHLDWMQRNLITQMRLFDEQKEQAYMYNVIHNMRYEWKDYAKVVLNQH